MTDSESRRWLYDQAKNKGVDLGDYDAFDKAMDDANNRKWVYDQATQKGLDLGDYDAYDKAIGPAPAPKSTKKEKEYPVSDIRNPQNIMRQPDDFTPPEGMDWESKPDTAVAETTSVKKPQVKDPIRTSYNPVSGEELPTDPYQAMFEDLSRVNAINQELETARARKNRTAGAYQIEEEAYGPVLPRNSSFQKEAKKDVARLEAEKKQLMARLDMNPEYRKHISEEADMFTEAKQDVLQRVQQRSSAGNFVPYTQDYMGPGAITPTVDREAMLDSAALALYDDGEKMLRSPFKYDESSGWANHFKGVKDKISDPDFWTLGLSEITDLSLLRSVLQKVQDHVDEIGESRLDSVIEDEGEDLSFLTQGEKELFLAYFANLEARRMRADDMSSGYKSGQTAADSVKFMVEMGYSGIVGKAATKGMTKYLTKKLASRLVNMNSKGLAYKLAKNGGGWGIKKAVDVVATVAGLPLTPDMPLGTLRRATELDENGRLPEIDLKLVANGTLDSGLEYFTERGSVIADGLKAFGKVVPVKQWASSFIGKDASEFVRSLSKTDMARLMKQGAWNGFVDEGLEEFDNAVYDYLRGNPDAISDFMSVDNLLELSASFAGMSLMGTAGSAAQVAQVNFDYNRAEKSLRDMMAKKGYSEDQIQHIIDIANGNSSLSELGGALTMVVNGQPGAGAVSEMRGRLGSNTEDFKVVKDYMDAAARRAAVRGLQEGQQDERIEQERQTLQQELGGHQFWQTRTTGGSTAENVVIAQVHANPNAGLQEGQTVFLTSTPDPTSGEMGYVTEDGQTGFIKADGIIPVQMNGVQAVSVERPLREYLSYRVMQKDAQEEQQEFAEQIQPQVEQLAQQYQVEDNVTIDGMNGVVVASNSDGIQVQFTDDKGREIVRPYSWEEIAQKQGTPMQVQTEEETVAAELGQREAMRENEERVAKIVRDNADKFITVIGGDTYTLDEVNPIVAGSVAEDGTASVRLVGPDGASITVGVNLTDLAKVQAPEAQAETPQEPQYEIPRTKGGEIDYDKLMEENPAEFARVNDEEMQDEGASTQTLFKNRVAELQKELKKNQENLAKQSKPSEMKKYQRKVADIQEKIAKLQSVLDGYNVMAEAPAEPVAEQPAAPAPEVVETPEATEVSPAVDIDVTEPMTLKELASMLFTPNMYGVLNRKDFMKEMGWGNSEARKFFRFWAKDGKGMTVNQLAEQLIEMDNEYGFIPYDRNADLKDFLAAKNAILEVLSESNSPGDLFNYVKNANEKRIEEAERFNSQDAYEAEQAAIAAEAARYGLSVEMYNRLVELAEEFGVGTDEMYDELVYGDRFEEKYNSDLPWTDEEAAEYDNIVADEIFEREQYGSENDNQGSEEVEGGNREDSGSEVPGEADGGREVAEPGETGEAVLPGEQPDNGGTGADVAVPEAGGESVGREEAGEDVPAGDVQGAESEVEEAEEAVPESADVENIPPKKSPQDIKTKEEAREYFEGLYGKGKKADSATRVWELTHKKSAKKSDTGDVQQMAIAIESDLSDEEKAELIQLGIQLAVDYIEGDGFVKFPPFFKNLVENFGDGIRPFTKQIYLGASAEVDDEIAEQMDDRKTVRAFDTSIDLNDIEDEQDVTAVREDGGRDSEVLADDSEGETDGGPVEGGNESDESGDASEDIEEGGLFPESGEPGETDNGSDGTGGAGTPGNGGRRGRRRNDGKGSGRGSSKPGGRRSSDSESGSVEDTGVGRESDVVDPEKQATEAEQKAYEAEKERIKDEADTNKLKSLKDELKSKISAIEDKFDLSRAEMNGKLRAIIERLRDLFSNNANKAEALNQEKVPYTPASDPEGTHSFGSVVPSGSADAMRDAIKRMEEEEGKSVADFVRDELGYKSLDEMFSSDGKDTGLSSEQVDSVGLAIHQMKKGKMFIVGDMTGVGKGRQGAAIIRWAKRQGKKVVFVTEKSDLFSDIYQDLSDIGTKDLLPFIVNNDAKANITNKATGETIIPHPSNAVAKELYKTDEDVLPTVQRGKLKGKQYDFVAMTYSQAQSARTETAKQKLDWIKRYANDAIIICDESHNASGDSKRGAFFQELVNNAQGVTFMSATFAKRPDNMVLYALRSSMGDAQMTREDLIKAIEEYGIPMQEILASNLFKTGEMVRRERDFTDVKTHWLDPKEIYSEEELSQCRGTFDQTIGIVNEIIDFQRNSVDPLIKKKNEEFEERNKLAEAELMLGKEATFFEYVVTPYSSQVSNVAGLMYYSVKAQKAAEMAIEQIKNGQKPVIAVENTLDSYLKVIKEDNGGETMNADFSFVLNRGLQSSMNYSLKITVKKFNKDTGKIEKVEEKCETKKMGSLEGELGEVGIGKVEAIHEIIDDYSKSKDIMPLMLSPIDYIKRRIEEAGYRCGEITGRNYQLVQDKETGIWRTEAFKADKKRAIREFNGGDAKNPLPKEETTDALILNTAGSTGISLHASKRFGDRKKRTMIILQPARDPNTEVQIRGRVDRTGQVSRAEYFYITSPIPAEAKIVMMLRQKLASLDANSVGTENVSSNRVNADDMDNKYGDEVARQFLIDHKEINLQLDHPIEEKKGEYEHREGLLYELLKGIQRMTCDEQEMVLAELQSAYKEQIDYLNQNGINDLATTTMNLEAVTIDSGLFIKGKDNESMSEFAHDTNIERVEVNVLNKPLRSSDINTRMSRLGALTDEGKIDTEYGDKIYKQAYNYTVDEYSARLNKYTAAEEKLEDELRELYPKLDAQSQEDYDNTIKMMPQLSDLKMKNRDALDRLTAEHTKQARAVAKATTYLKPGLPVFVPLTDELKDTSPMSFGRFIGFKVPKDGKPKGIKAVFAVKDSRASIEIPVVGKADVIARVVDATYGSLGRDMGLRNIGGESWDSSITDEMRRPARDEWWDKMIPKNTSRSIRYMVTGNVLQACGSLGKYKGTITTFTRKDADTGEITVEKGMLLAEDFDPENFAVRSAVTKPDVWDGYDQIRDSVSSISVQREGDRMVVRFYKQGKENLSKHPINKDQGFKDLVAGGEIFAYSRDELRAFVNEENVEKALDYLYKNYSFTKSHLFVMPDSTERVDAIVYTDRPYQDIIDEFGKKYGSTYLYSAEDKLKKALVQYKMDINNEDLKQRIRELVQLRQAFYRQRYASDESSRLAWQVIVYDQAIEQAGDNKALRDQAYAVREAIKEELASRNVHGNPMHFEAGNVGLDKMIETFNKLNKNKTNAEIAKRVFPIVKKLKLDVVLNEKIPNETGGQTAGQVVEYNWKYMNAEWITDQMKADTILHELTHTVTVYAKRLVDGGYEHLINQDIIDAVQQLDQIYSSIKYNSNFKHDISEGEYYTDYGVSNWFEMLAEFGSNELFRDDLRRTTLGVKVMSGMLIFSDVTKRTDYTGKSQSAYDAIMERFDILIDNFSEHGFTEYFRGTMYGERSYSKFSEEDARRQSDVTFAKALLDGTLGVAPNGQKSNLTDDQWSVARTDAFKEWFGDWQDNPTADMELDENGEPTAEAIAAFLDGNNPTEPNGPNRRYRVQKPGRVNDAAAKRDKLQNTEPVPVQTGIIRGDRGKKALQEAIEWFKTNIGGPRHYNTEVGEVVIDEQSIRSSLAHRYGQRKLDAITSLFDGFERSTYLTAIEDLDGKNEMNYFFAYPISYDGGLSYVLCRAKKGKGQNRLYIHEVFPVDTIKGDTLQATAEDKSSRRGIALYLDILRDVFNDKDSNDFDNIQTIITETAEKLNTPVVIEHGTPDGVRNDALGWYEPKDNSVHVNVDAARSPADAIATVLHETVGHHGLRKLLGDKFDKSLQTLRSMATKEIREKIDTIAKEQGVDELTAMEEYLAQLAEQGATNNEELSFLEKAKAFVRSMLRYIGVDMGGITEADLNYLIWASRRNLEQNGGDLLRAADNAIIRGAMKRMAQDSHEVQRETPERLYRSGTTTDYSKAVIAKQYEKRIAEGGILGYQFREAMQDSMLSLRDFMLMTLKAEGKDTKYIEDVPGFENAYLSENALSSKTKIEQDTFGKLLFEPFVKEISQLAKTEEERQELTDYMMAKHGLERNEKFAQRDAIRFYKNIMDATIEAARKDKSLDDDARADAIDAAQAEFEAHKQEIEAGQDKKYQEFRKQDYSGLTALTKTDNVSDAESKAKDMVRDYEFDHDTDELWKKTKDVTSAIMSKMGEGGIVTRTAAKEITDMFEFYIPLRGFDETTSDEAYAYLDDAHGPLNSPILGAEGRESKADDPIATLANMADTAIMQANRNEMKQKFLNFVLNHPTDLVSVNDLWIQFNDVTGEWEAVFADLKEGDAPAIVDQKVQDFEQHMQELAEQEPDKYKKAKDAKNIPYRVINGHLKEHQILIKRLGKTYVLTVNGNPRLAQALNGETNPDAQTKGVLGAVGRIAKSTTTTLSQLYTTRNPEFIASNFMRDAIYANTMAWIKENSQYAAAFNKNFGRVNPARMVKLLSKFEKNELDESNPVEKAFKEFMMNGGETGYTNIKDIEKQKKEIKKQIQKMQGSMPISKAMDFLGDEMDLLNRAVENCARFAAFLTSREQGRDLERSIYDAKEISVNFNKKGAGDRFYRGTGQTWWGNAGAFLSGAGREFYAFWNAGLQGTTNFARAAKRHPYKFGFGAAAMFTTGVLMPMMYQYLFGGDDDDKDNYYNLPEYIRRSNICFKAGDKWITIPLPIEMRAIYGLGELAAGQMMGQEGYDAQELAYQIGSQVSQVLPLDMLEGGGGLHALIPTGLKPVAEAYMNKKWTGLPLYQQKSQWNEDMPEWTKAFKSANPLIVNMTAELNGLTAEYGDKYEKGVVNLNPARIEYMLNGYFGGYATTAQALVKMAEMGIDGEWNWSNALIARRFLKSADETTEYRKLNNEYYELRDEYEHIKKQLKRYETNEDTERQNKLEASDKFKRFEIMNGPSSIDGDKNYYQKIDELNRAMKIAEDPEEAVELEKEKYDLIRDLMKEIHALDKKEKGKD